jgi:hypothetical protein
MLRFQLSGVFLGEAITMDKISGVSLEEVGGGR